MNFSLEEQNKIRELYSIFWSDREIARELNTTHYRIGKFRNKNNLPNLRRRKPSILLVGQDKAKCSRCGDIKDVKLFITNRRGKKNEYKLSYCNICRREQYYAMINRSTEKYLNYLTTRLRAKCSYRNIYCDITTEQIINIWKEQQGKCFYTGLDLIMKQGQGYNRQRCSFDKIIPSKGYIAKNIVLCIQKANTVKNDLSLAELRDWIPGWYEKLINKFPELKEETEQCN